LELADANCQAESFKAQSLPALLEARKAPQELTRTEEG
jgi:hypothetical protein